MSKTSTLFFIADNNLDPEFQLINLDQFFESMDSDLDNVFGKIELSPAYNIQKIINLALPITK